jgi:hypothetical protein
MALADDPQRVPANRRHFGWTNPMDDRRGRRDAESSELAELSDPGLCLKAISAAIAVPRSQFRLACQVPYRWCRGTLGWYPCRRGEHLRALIWRKS